MVFETDLGHIHTHLIHNQTNRPGKGRHLNPIHCTRQTAIGRATARQMSIAHPRTSNSHSSSSYEHPMRVSIQDPSCSAPPTTIFPPPPTHSIIPTRRARHHARRRRAATWTRARARRRRRDGGRARAATVGAGHRGGADGQAGGHDARVRVEAAARRRRGGRVGEAGGRRGRGAGRGREAVLRQAGGDEGAGEGGEWCVGRGRGGAGVPKAHEQEGKGIDEGQHDCFDEQSGRGLGEYVG